MTGPSPVRSIGRPVVGDCGEDDDVAHVSEFLLDEGRQRASGVREIRE